MADIENTIIDDMLASEEMSLLDTPAFSAGDAMAQGGMTEDTLMAFNFLRQLMDFDIESGAYDAVAAEGLGLNRLNEFMSRMEGKGDSVLTLLDQALRMDTGQQPKKTDPNTGQEIDSPSWQIEGGTALQNIFGGDFELMLRAAKMYAEALAAGGTMETEGPGIGDRTIPDRPYDPALENTPNPPAGYGSITKP